MARTGRSRTCYERRARLYGRDGSISRGMSSGMDRGEGCEMLWVKTDLPEKRADHRGCAELPNISDGFEISSMTSRSLSAPLIG
jgi:hypothetical protein